MFLKKTAFIRDFFREKLCEEYELDDQMVMDAIEQAQPDWFIAMQNEAWNEGFEEGKWEAQ